MAYRMVEHFEPVLLAVAFSGHKAVVIVRIQILTYGKTRILIAAQELHDLQRSGGALFILQILHQRHAVHIGQKPKLAGSLHRKGKFSVLV